MALVRHLRWDVEEDLSRLIGDGPPPAALVQAGRDLAAGRRMRCVASPTASPITPARRAACWCGAGSSKRWAGLSRCCAMPSSVWKNGSRALARLTRLLRIFAVGLRSACTSSSRALRAIRSLRLAARRTGEPRARRLREALEDPWVRFTSSSARCCRRDANLVPLDIADELAQLQDRVPPFPSALAVAEIEQGLGRKSKPCSPRSSANPWQSASIAQVHLATAARRPRSRRQGAAAARRRGDRQGRGAAATGAEFVERLWPDGRRLKPREVVAEFARHLGNELQPDARGRERQPAAPQLRALGAAAGARSALGPVLRARDGDAAHARHAGVAGRDPAARRGSIFPRSRAQA